MFVYYDNVGNIKSISPNENCNLSKEYNLAIFSIDLVEDFLKGRKNPLDYQVKRIKNLSGVKFTITKKTTTINIIRTLDNFLTKIDNTVTPSIINVYNNYVDKNITIKLSEEFINLYNTGDDIQIDIISDFIKTSYSTIYITEKNNPYKLYKSIMFLPRTLFENGKLCYNCDVAYKNTSAYTKKIVSLYRYNEGE
jgi:hypothetical protein